MHTALRLPLWPCCSCAGGSALSVRVVRCLLLICLATVLLSKAVCASTWPAWRGGERLGHGESTNAPLSWTPREGVLWKTPIPGAGYSSPVVSASSVYVTTTYLKDDARYLKFVVYGLLLGVMLSAGFIYVGEAQEPGCQPVRRHPMARTAAYGVGLLMLAALVLYGESALDYARCPIRSWLAGNASLTLCLAVASFATPTSGKLRLALGIGALAQALLIPLGIPAKDHAYRTGFLGQQTLTVMAFAALPLALGCTLLRRFERPRGLSERPTDPAPGRAGLSEPSGMGGSTKVRRVEDSAPCQAAMKISPDLEVMPTDRESPTPGRGTRPTP